MIVTKPYIREFKGVPIYISFFVIYETRRPVIKTRALEIIAKVNGKCTRRITPSIQILDIPAFYEASMAFLIMAFKKTKKYREIGKL